MGTGSEKSTLPSVEQTERLTQLSRREPENLPIALMLAAINPNAASNQCRFLEWERKPGRPNLLD